MSSVLIVEPDRRIGSFIAGILGEFGHQVLHCRDAADAADCLAQTRFDVVATDQVNDCAGLAPDLPMLTLSGRLLHPVSNRAARLSRLNDKPFRFADLHMLVTAVGAISPPSALAA